MLIQPDFSEAQDPFEPGTYYMRIIGAEIKDSKKGDKYLNWSLESFNEEDPKNNGRRHWHITMLTGRGAGMLKQFYKAATGEPLEGEFDTEQLVGRELLVTLADDDQGRTQTKAIKPIQ